MTEVTDDISYEQSRKRKTRTSDEQYKIYLHEMEQDYAFRSGIIDPALGADYLHKKWKLLSKKLNSTRKGPQLLMTEWKRRFKDWKNSTRAKYRKMLENSDGGYKLSALEERGLALWGSTRGFSCIQEVDLPKTSYTIPVIDAMDSTTSHIDVSEPFSLTTICDPGFTTDKENEQNENSEIHIRLTDGETQLRTKRPQSLNQDTNNLDTYSSSNSLEKNNSLVNVIEKLTRTYKEIETEKLKTEKRKLQFEIQKYKFENPDFKIADNFLLN